MQSILMALILTCAVAPAGDAKKRATYQIIGKIGQSDGTPFRGVTPLVFLHGAITPFNAQAQVGPDGKFKFKNIPAGTYNLIAAVPQLGEMRKTIEVGPSFADSSGKITTTIVFERALLLEKRETVSAVELSVSEAAKEEYLRALDCVKRQDIKGAIARLKKAAEISPQFAIAWNHLGTIAYQTREYGQAEEYFREALRQNPEAYAPLVNLGGALLSLNKFQESLAVNLEAVKARPGDPLAQAQLGKSYFFLGRLDDAEMPLKRAKALDPSHFSHPQLMLIKIYLRKSQLPAAIAEMEEFLRLHPDSEFAPQIRRVLETARSESSAKP